MPLIEQLINIKYLKYINKYKLKINSMILYWLLLIILLKIKIIYFYKTLLIKYI